MGLSDTIGIIFVICMVMIFAFEFVNGFHDTANAVATVIYTNTLKPTFAVVWSGCFNFLGVFISSIWGFGVATKIASLLPVEAIMSQTATHGAAMVLGVICGAIIWNLGTWYFGIPCSSSHTLIGAIIGVGLVYSTLPENTTHQTVNWEEAFNIGRQLLLSPLFGFAAAIVAMFVLRASVSTDTRKALFKEPDGTNRPPLWIRAILVTTCTLVSFFHGFNDGQKGIGLVMVALMTFLPLQNALSPNFSADKAANALNKIEANLPKKADNTYAPLEVSKTAEVIQGIRTDLATANTVQSRLSIRKRFSLLDKNVKTLLAEPNIITDDSARNSLKIETHNLVTLTHYAPVWSVFMICVALGLGTMIGWKRIVVTIGEKIGKRHMTYAEGATAELVAASTIGLSSFFSLPVSTTHVLSSGIAGAMVATKGVKNLQGGTLANIALAWVLTLPASIILAGAFYLLFRAIL